MRVRFLALIPADGKRNCRIRLIRQIRQIRQMGERGERGWESRELFCLHPAFRMAFPLRLFRQCLEIGVYALFVPFRGGFILLVADSGYHGFVSFACFGTAEDF